MKRLVAILALLLSPALYGQEIVYPYADATQTGNLVPNSTFDGANSTVPDGWQQTTSTFSGGSIQNNCGVTGNGDKCYYFSYEGATLSTVIDLSIYNTNSFEFFFDFYYRMNCNNSIGGFCENPQGPQDLFGASVQFFTTNGEAGAFNFIPIGPDYFTDYRQVGWYSSQQSEYLFTSAIVSFYGVDSGYWGGYYGPQLDDVSFRIGYLTAPEEPIAVDCAIYPYDQSCIIQNLTDFNDEDILLADTNDDTGSDDGSDDGTEIVEEDEEILLAEEDIVEEELEELLTDDTLDEMIGEELDEEVLVENNATYRELSDEEKAAILADAISKITIEGALSIASEVAGSTNVASATTETSSSRSTSTTSTTQETTVADNKNEDNKTENTDSSSSDALDLLETGRVQGQQALAATQQQTDISASDSISQAENIAMNNTVAGRENDFGRPTEDNADTFDVSALSDSTQSIEDTTMNIMVNVLEENNASMDNIISEDGRVNLAQYGFTDNVAEDDTKQFEDVVVNNSIDINGTAFLGQPNVRDLEILGVIGKQEEKSDAEKRAEEVVAANKEQQDEINKNYMEADQSGIVAAMADGTDVTSYRTAMLPDLPSWYKPEDIYKNVVYKDNARGMYFLEKGNTDTYKKMVEEQYK